MAGFEVTLGNGTKVTINAKDNIGELKKKFADDAEQIFEGVDDGDNILQEGEMVKLKANLEAKNYKVAVSEDGKTSKKAFNDAIQNMSHRYNKDAVKTYFVTKPENLHVVGDGENLTRIAKKTLETEGLPINQKAINDRIAQIAVLNGLTDVNNIRKDQKLIVKLTNEGIQKVKESDNNSAVALGGNVQPAPVQAKQDGASEVSTASTETVQEEESPIKITSSGILETWGEGEEISNDGFEWPGAIDIKKHTITKDGETKTKYVLWADPGIWIADDSLENLKTKWNSYYKKEQELKDAQEGETEEQAKERKIRNVNIIREAISIVDGNIDAVLWLIGGEYLHDDDYLDKTSDEYKALVRDLIKTKNPAVLRELFTSDNQFIGTLENDEEGTKLVASMYEKLIAKQNRGEKLTNTEVDLKEVLDDASNKFGYKIAADTEKGIYEKAMCFNTPEGKIAYSHETADGLVFKAYDKDTLDAFLKDLAAADDDTKKAALFNKYMNTEDEELAVSLAVNAVQLKANIADLKTFVSKQNAYVISGLVSEETEKNKELNTAIAARFEKIFKEEKGNLNNTLYFEDAKNAIEGADLSDEEKAAKLASIIETYFEVTEKDGTKTYKFNPSRRPTSAEALDLYDYANDDMKKAMAEYIKLEDMGKGQYNAGIEREIGSAENPVTSHYAKMVENMTTREEVIDFIKDKIQSQKHYTIPFDTIMAKFPNDKEINTLLIEYLESESGISAQNRIAIVKSFMGVDNNGNLKFGEDEKKALPEGVDVKVLLSVLPKECKNGDGKACFELLANQLEPGKAYVDFLLTLKDKNTAVVRQKLGALVAENKDDSPFIQKMLSLDSSVRPTNNIKKHANADVFVNYVKSLEPAIVQAYLKEFINKDSVDFVIRLLKECNTSIPKEIITVMKWPNNELFNELKRQKLITETSEKGIYTIKNVSGFYKVVENQFVEASNVAAKLNQMNVQNWSSANAKKQIEYVKNLGKMSPSDVAQAFLDYKFYYNNAQGLLEGLDMTPDGAALPDMMKLVQKVLVYAQQKGKTNTQEYKNVISLMQEYKEYFAEPVTEENATTVAVADKWKDKDFTTGWGTMTSLINNRARKFDNVVYALIKVCK